MVTVELTHKEYKKLKKSDIEFKKINICILPIKEEER